MNKRIWDRIRDIAFWSGFFLLIAALIVGLFLASHYLSPYLILASILWYVMRLPWTIREALRRQCPIHKETFERETFVVGDGDMYRRRNTSCRCGGNCKRAGIGVDADRLYPYARPRACFGPGTHHVWYCRSCRKERESYIAEHLLERDRNRTAEWLERLSPVERKRVEAQALLELEALERRLGLTVQEEDGSYIVGTYDKHEPDEG
jgi:hypothetical protein